MCNGATQYGDETGIFILQCIKIAIHTPPLSWMLPYFSSRPCDPLAECRKAGEGRRAAQDEPQDMSWVEYQWRARQSNRKEMWIPRMVSCRSLGYLWACCFILHRRSCFTRGDTQHRLSTGTCVVCRCWGWINGILSIVPVASFVSNAVERCRRTAIRCLPHRYRRRDADDLPTLSRGKTPSEHID